MKSHEHVICFLNIHSLAVIKSMCEVHGHPLGVLARAIRAIRAVTQVFHYFSIWNSPTAKKFKLSGFSFQKQKARTYDRALD